MSAKTYPADAQWLTEMTKRLVEVDSTVGYYPEIQPAMEKIASELGYEMTWDNKRTGYIRVPGKDRDRCVLVGAHLDTIGFIVRGFNNPENEAPTLRIRRLGGVNWASTEGETVHIHCRNGNTVDGQVIVNHHSVHAWEDTKNVERDENSMSIAVIGDVKTEDDLKALGITPGAIVSVDPHFEAFDNGYIVSRHIDDKGCVAALLGTLKWIRDENITPACDVLFAFPIYEEIGHGGAFVPAEVSEYVAVDISLIGPDYESNEHQVGVIASDAHGPYDWGLTNQLIECAENSLDAAEWNTQVCFHYSTDAMAAYIKGYDIKAAAFGPCCINTHGRERCHVDALVHTQQLTCAYIDSL